MTLRKKGVGKGNFNFQIMNLIETTPTVRHERNEELQPGAESNLVIKIKNLFYI